MCVLVSVLHDAFVEAAADDNQFLRNREGCWWPCFWTYDALVSWGDFDAVVSWRGVDGIITQLTHSQNITFGGIMTQVSDTEEFRMT